MEEQTLQEEKQPLQESAVLVLQEKDKLPVRSKKTNQNEGPVLGHTLLDILYDTAARFPNPRMFNYKRNNEWVTMSLEDYKNKVELLAASLKELGLKKGEKVALYMESDPFFCLADMACLLAGLIDVPIYLKQSPGSNEFILKHSEARAIFVSSLSRLRDIDVLLAEAPQIKTVIVAEPEENEKLTPLPEGVRWFSMKTLIESAKEILEVNPDLPMQMRAEVNPGDLATIVYTSGTTGEPKGVMLTHENLSSNAITAFQTLTGGPRRGLQKEVGISFLPLTHIFARTLNYATLAFSLTVYYTNPEDLADDLKVVRPTMFASVPRLLEKVYGKILQKITNMTGFQKRIANWSLDIANQFEVGTRSSLFKKSQLRLANALVFRKWRAALGGRVKYIIVGGAAMSEELVNIFGAAGVKILQGYGLTETSPVISFNRPDRNRPGTVGEALPGVEVRIAEDGEILSRGPNTMQGYYKNEEKTREVLTEDGWFHTGDIGELSEDGFLRITDRKKDLFKLSTGKYVMPQPLENRLVSHPLIEQAVVVGPGRKYCSVLLFVEQNTLRIYAESIGMDKDFPVENLVKHPKIIDKYQQLVDIANEGMDHWSTIKHFTLILEQLTVENGLLTPKMSIRRKKICDRYKGSIDGMYVDAH